jgi:hypothetical protein
LKTIDSAPGRVSGVSSTSAGFFVSAVCAWRRTLVDKKRIVEIWRKGIMGLDRMFRIYRNDSMAVKV